MKRIAVAASLLLAGATAAPAQEAGPTPGRFRIHTEAYFYDTDILRDAYSREPYRTTILIDTMTGRSWILMKVGDNRVVWSSLDFVNPAGPTPGLAPPKGPGQ
jgi:hypothetical protein